MNRRQLAAVVRGAVLGVTGLGHDPAACLFIDGKLVCAVEEERLNRQKDTWDFPHCAIQWVLKSAGLRFGELSGIAYYWDDRGQFLRMLRRTASQLRTAPAGIARLVLQRFSSYQGSALLRRQLVRHCHGDYAGLPPIYYVPHHEAHLAAAWTSAPFEPNAGLVIDGRGEYAATSLYKLGRRRDGWRPRCVEDFAFPNSLGVFYGAITQLLGYQAVSDEYKVMGLASYGGGDPRWERAIGEFLTVRDDGCYQLNLRLISPERCSSPEWPWLSERGAAVLSGEYLVDGEFTDESKAVAFAAQRRLELALQGLLRRLVYRTRANRVVITGGVAMNGVAIGRMREMGIVDELHVPLAPGDSGSCIGAVLALLMWGDRAPDPETLQNPFLGPTFSDSQVEELLRSSRWSYQHAEQPWRVAAQEVAAGRIVGWFSGAAEFGARALGARSILGDPRRVETRDHLNRTVKRRESFRPFAPSVLEEDAGRYFSLAKCRMMNEVTSVLPGTREIAPAIVHIDGTARPQTVPADSPHPEFRRLIEVFRDLTGVPMVVNTSFNVRGEPIVCSPEDALRCFAASGLTSLVMGSFLIRKSVETNARI